MTYDEIAAELEPREVTKSKMFGMPCLKLDTGKAFAGDYNGDMVFKLVKEADQIDAMKLPGAHLFEPMPGHAMKQWVVVPASQSSEWLRLATAALDGMSA